MIDHLDMDPTFAHQGMRGTVECMAAKKELLCGKCTRQHSDVPFYPNMLFNGLSRILDLLYSKFCGATRALIRYFSVRALQGDDFAACATDV